MDGPLDLKQALQRTLNPRDYYRHLRTLWALSLCKQVDLSDPIVQTCLRHPFVSRFPPSARIASLLGIEQYVSFSELDGTLSLSELCELSLLKVICKTEEAEPLIRRLLPLLAHRTLWTPESMYAAQEFDFFSSLLHAYVGASEHVERASSRDPFLLSLQAGLAGKQCLIEPPVLGPSYDKTHGWWASASAAFTLSGFAAPLGSMCHGDVEVRAFGPQFYPLTQSHLFGVQGRHSAETIDLSHISGWTRCFGQPAVWLYAAFHQGCFGYTLNLRWSGLVPEKKGGFAFYIKANQAEIYSHTFRSGSLERYRGRTPCVSFQEGALTITFANPRLIDIIPLAGKGCFWDADFLLAIEADPVCPTEVFSLSFTGSLC